LVGWEIYYTDEKRRCVCSPCWNTLKGALGENLPRRDIFIRRAQGLHPVDWYRDNAEEYDGPNGSVNVAISEAIDIQLPELDANGKLVWNRTPFDIVLWHEAIGHGYFGLSGHPNRSSNRRGGTFRDPVIAQENVARSCLRLQGIAINDRVPTYYGWRK